MLSPDPLTAHLTASAVVIDTTARTVLLAFHKASGCWVFPGGHVDGDRKQAAGRGHEVALVEMLHQAALREVEEETGIRAYVVEYPTLDTGASVELPGMTLQASPWVTALIPAPAKPHRGEGPHRHLDALFIARPFAADLGKRPGTRGDDGVASARWFRITELDGIGARPDVPPLARQAFRILREMDAAGRDFR